MCCDHKILKRQHSETMAKYILAFKMLRFEQKLSSMQVLTVVQATQYVF